MWFPDLKSMFFKARFSFWIIRFFSGTVFTLCIHFLMEEGIFYCIILIKGSIFLKNGYFMIQERFNKLLNGINIIIKSGTWQPVKFYLVSRPSNEMIFYPYFWVDVANINSRYDIKKSHFCFDPVQKRGTNLNFTGCQMPHFMIVLVLSINLLYVSWMKKKCLFLRNIEPLIAKFHMYDSYFTHKYMHNVYFWCADNKYVLQKKKKKKKLARRF